MIDLKQQLREYSPILLENYTQNMPDIPDNIRNSILLYNKALDNIRTNSEDIAIIELKKAVAMNPDFSEAMNLLGLCYASVGEVAKATELFQKVMKSENSGVKASNYISMIQPSTQNAMSQKTKKIQLKPPEIKPKKEPKKFFKEALVENIGIKDLLKYLLSFAAGALIVLFVTFLTQGDIHSNVIGTSNMDDQTYDSSSESSGGTQSSEDAGYKEKYQKLSQDFSALQKQLEAANGELDYYKSVSVLDEISNLSDQAKYIEAAQRLLALESSDLKDTEKNRYEQLCQGIYPKASMKVYNDLYSLYKEGKYSEVIQKYESIPAFGKAFPEMNKILYNLGKCYAETNDLQKANALFERIVADYPGSEYAEYASARIVHE